MTEHEWLACSDPIPMLQHLEGRAGERKLRLFACACCRRIVSLSDDESLLLAVESSGRYADGFTTTAEMSAAWEAADTAVWAFNGVFSEQLALAAVERATKTLAPRECARACQRALEAFEQERAWLPWGRRSALWWSEMRAKGESAVGEERRHQAVLLRCIFGNPFRPVDFDEVWLTPDVFSLARMIYDDQEFDGMTVLAEALERAGCTDAEILCHCRAPGPHAKGCWVVDAFLGRS